MDINKLKDVLSDKTFVEQLLSMEDEEQVQVALKEKGIDITLQQIDEIKDYIDRYQNNQLSEQEKNLLEAAQKNINGQLSDEELESVSGGIVVIDTLIVALFIGIIVGGGIYETVKSIRRSRW